MSEKRKVHEQTDMLMNLKPLTLCGLPVSDDPGDGPGLYNVPHERATKDRNAVTCKLCNQRASRSAEGADV